MTSLSDKPFDAALLMPIPEVEPLLSQYRMAHDPSTADGGPAHITINYPFLPGLDFSEIQHLDLKRFFNGFPSFEFSFPRLERFPDAFICLPRPANHSPNSSKASQVSFQNGLPIVELSRR